MNARKQIAAVALLAGLAVPLAACGDDGADQADQRAQATAAARVYVADWQRVIASCPSAGTGYHRATDTQACQDSDRDENPCRESAYVWHGGSAEDVDSCARKLLTRAERGTPIPTPTAASTATPAPAQQASSSSSGIGSALVGFVQLALGALCVLGLPALVIWGAIAGRRRARAVHRQGAAWQQPAPAPAPMYDSRTDYDAFDTPQQPDHNPWA